MAKKGLKALLGILAVAAVSWHLHAEEPPTVVGSGLNTLVFGKDCSLGQLVGLGGQGSMSGDLYFRLRTPSGDWQPAEEISGSAHFEAALFQRRHGGVYRWEVLRAAGFGLELWVRENDGTWRWEQSISGGGGASFEQMAVSLGDDGRIHVAAATGGFGEPELWYFTTDAETEAWQSELVESFSQRTVMEAFDFPHNVKPARMLSLGVESNGTPHIVFSADQTSTPVAGGTRVSSDLFHFHHDGNAWVRQTLVASASGHDDAGLGASLAVAPDGTVAVAASYLPRAPTGSPGRAHLRYMTRNADGTWSQEVVATHADGYASFDGEAGTGLYPYLVFDGDSRPHVVFTDHASEHTLGTAFSYSGQMRHATRDAARSGGWQLRTLVRQPTGDAFLRRLDFPVVAASSAKCGNRPAFFARYMDVTEFPEYREDYFEFFLLEGDPVEPDPRWTPGDWVYFLWPYIYSLESGSWYFFDAGGDSMRVDLENGIWEGMSLSEGWHYFLWPYAYAHERDTWFWHYLGAEQWVVNMDTGIWALLGD